MLTTPQSLFRTRLIFLVLLVVVPAFGLVLHGTLNQRQIETMRAREGAVAISQMAAANQESFIDNTRQLLGTMAQFKSFVLSTNRNYCETHFQDLRRVSPAYLNFGLIELNGDLFCNATTTNAEINVADRAYFRRVLATGKFAVGDFQVGRATRQPSLNFGHPIFDEKSRLARVIYASLRLSVLSDSIAEIQMPAGATLMTVDREGTVLARFPVTGPALGQSLAGNPVVQRVLSRQDDVFEMPGVDGVARIHAVTALPRGPSPALFVVVGIPLEASLAAANESLIRNLILLGLVALAVIVAVRIYSNHYFLKPVTGLASAAHRLAEGDLGARADPVSGVAELVQLGDTLNHMAARLQKREEEVDRANQQVIRLNQELESRVRERTAQLEVANKELESFSYSVSHDLRAPLRHIDGFVSMLHDRANGKLDPVESRYVETIKDSTRQMGVLIDDLLGFSRMSRAEMRTASVNLSQLTTEILASLEPDLKGRNIEWKLGGLPTVEGDPALLRQVWVNLLSNAIKYTRPRDPARIEIGCLRKTPDEVVIFVRDNGVGFDLQYATKLFGVFQRMHRADEFEGTGIGLAIVQRIILRHGGRIWAESKPDEGATFYFTFAHRNPVGSPAPAVRS